MNCLGRYGDVMTYQILKKTVEEIAINDPCLATRKLCQQTLNLVSEIEKEERDHLKKCSEQFIKDCIASPKPLT